jgi:ABC-type amino acid transport substrate-binding protein
MLAGLNSTKRILFDLNQTTNMKTIGILKLWPSAKAVNLMKVCGAAVVAAGLGLGGTSSSLAADTNAAPGGAPLRVGMAPDYPPVAFRQPAGVDGLEVDFAKALGQELGRPVEFVTLKREELIDYLLNQKVDIIMSGMSVTKARQLRVSFADPYVRNQLRAIFPVKAAAQFKTKDDVVNAKAKIGVITGTVAETFVKQNCTNAQLVNFTARENIPFYLLRDGRMDLYIDDTFALAYMFSKNEANMAYLPDALSEDTLAWGIRPGDTELLAQANKTLAKWKANGTLEQILTRWVPYVKKLNEAPPAAPQ